VFRSLQLQNYYYDATEIKHLEVGGGASSYMQCHSLGERVVCDLGSVDNALGRLSTTIRRLLQQAKITKKNRLPTVKSLFLERFIQVDAYFYSIN